MQIRSYLDCGEAADHTISCQRKKELKHFTCHLKLWSNVLLSDAVVPVKGPDSLIFFSCTLVLLIMIYDFKYS